MELFNQIRVKTENAIKENEGAVNDVGRWREDIRDMVMRVRSNFIAFIDEFVAHLNKNLIDVRKQPHIKDFVQEDTHQEARLKVLKRKHK